MLNPIDYLEYRREHLLGLLQVTNSAEETLKLSMKIENIEYEIQRAHQVNVE